MVQLPADDRARIEHCLSTGDLTQATRLSEALLAAHPGDAEVQSLHASVLMARGEADGVEILNDVVLNQVLVRHVDGPTTEALIAAVQADGRVWCGPTQWDGATAMRISVSSWKTTAEDATFAADVILECARSLTRS